MLGGLGTVQLCLAAALLAFGETAIFMDLLVPGEVGLVVAGAAAAGAHHPLLAVIAAAAVGAAAGDTVSYAVGRRWGRPLVDRFELTRRRLGPVIEEAERHFQAHGGLSVFGARWVGALRAVVPFVAGVARLRLRTFLLWNGLASVLWASAVVGLGAALGRPVASVVDRLGAWLSLVVVTVLLLLWFRRRHRRRLGGGGRVLSA
jgi:membrane-associated protein